MDGVLTSVYTDDYDGCRDFNKNLGKHLGLLSQRSHFIIRHSQEVNSTGYFFNIFITDRSPSRKLNLDSLSDELCKHWLHSHLSKTAKLTYFYRAHVKEHKAIILHGSKGSFIISFSIGFMCNLMVAGLRSTYWNLIKDVDEIARPFLVLTNLIHIRLHNIFHTWVIPLALPG